MTPRVAVCTVLATLVVATLVVATLSPMPASAQIALAGTITGTTFDSEERYCILIYPPPPECAAPATRSGVTIVARSVMDPGGGQPVQEQPGVAPLTTTSGPDGSYTLPNVGVGLWRLTAQTTAPTFSAFSSTGSGSAACRADSVDGATSKTVSIDFGQTVQVDWYCGAPSGLGSLFGFAIPGLGDLGLFRLLLGQLPSFGIGFGGLFGAPPTSPAPPPGDVTGTAVVHFGADAVRAEVASTPAERARGLSFRTSLGPDEGMLFIFPAPTTAGFTMKDTLIPLSIAYLREASDAAAGVRTYSVVSILDMQPCRADPCPTYSPAAPYDAALEVNQGWFAERGITAGAPATVEGNLPVPS